MKTLLNYIKKKLIKYRRAVIKIVVLFCLLIPLLFLYKYFLNPLEEISSINSLKNKSDFILIDSKLVDQVAGKVKEKTTAQSSVNIDNLKSPFDRMVQEVKTSEE